MKDFFGKLGNYAIGAVFLLLVFALPALFIAGAVWVSEKLLPFLFILSGVAFLLVLFVLMPLAAFRKTRGFASTAVFMASYVFGATAWMQGLLATYFLWGGFAVVVGLFFLGVGVVPLGIVAALFHAEWLLALSLFVNVVVAFGTRLLAFKFAEEADEAARAEAVLRAT